MGVLLEAGIPSIAEYTSIGRNTLLSGDLQAITTVELLPLNQSDTHLDPLIQRITVQNLSKIYSKVLLRPVLRNTV